MHSGNFRKSRYSTLLKSEINSVFGEEYYNKRNKIYFENGKVISRFIVNNEPPKIIDFNFQI